MGQAAQAGTAAATAWCARSGSWSRRASRCSPTAAATAPPAPDKTAYKPGQGFTGLEAVWNYIYYQTLGINLFDDASHLLRIILIQNACAPYAVKPTPQQYKDCGPNIGAGGPGGRGYAPGVLDPDPTEGAAVGAAENLSPEENIKRFGLRRGAGEPEAPALPGQRDISQPQVSLPPDVQALIDQIRGQAGADTPAVPGGGADPSQMLDFLMAP